VKGRKGREELELIVTSRLSCRRLTPFYSIPSPNFDESIQVFRKFVSQVVTELSFFLVSSWYTFGTEHSSNAAPRSRKRQQRFQRTGYKRISTKHFAISRPRQTVSLSLPFSLIANSFTSLISHHSTDIFDISSPKYRFSTSCSLGF